MTLQDLRLLLDYHYWARDRILDAVDPLTLEQYTRDLGNSFRSIRGTLVHTYAGEWAWHLRWRGTSPTALLAGDQFPELAILRTTWLDHEQQVRAFLEGLGDAGITRRIEYTLLSGVSGSAPFWQMFQHVVNHATYHRGQVTTMLRQIGASAPKSMDMSTFYRENGL